MTLYFVRHGESLANEQNYFAGSKNSPLTLLGRRQAQQAAHHIQRLGVVFDEVHVSTLERAQATASIILERAAGTPRIVTSAALIERDFGIFAGKNKTLIKKSIGHRLYDYCFHHPDGAPPQGEHWMDMFARCKAYYDDVLAPLEQAGKHVLVVAHKYIVEIFALIASGLSPDEYIDFRLPNSRPLSWDELKRMTARSSATLNYIGEHVEIFLLQWMLAAALGGFALSLFGIALPRLIDDLAIVCLLGLNAFFLAQRIEPGSLRASSGPENIALAIMSLGRVACAGVLLLCFHNHGAYLIGLLLIVPPALSVPTFSLARGGDYFFAVRYTLVLSVVLPAVLAVLAMQGHYIIGDARPLQRFFIVLVIALALPSLAAQLWRRAHPIAAGRMSTNWGWVGSLAMVPLAFLVSLRSGGPLVANALRSGDWSAWGALSLPFLLFGANRVVSWLYVRIQQRLAARPIEPAVARDIHLLQTSPNVFLWLSLLMPSSLHEAPTLVAGTLLGFFAFALVDEALVVRRFREAITQRVFGRIVPVT
ncbi:histidine phosphatase family protein [Trinickia sp.]|uniref:histidine phosphatase family protein n=1 Tax=Trinickia sp. TaxID=2571163 RepID=UPI003F7EF209